MSRRDRQKPSVSDDALERAAAWLLRRETAEGAAEATSSAADSAIDPGAVREVKRAWDAVGEHAAAPELMLMRERALARLRQQNARCWRSRPRVARAMIASAAAVLAAIGAAVWMYERNAGVYATGFGEQHVVELQDHSRIALDGQTRLRVRYTADARFVELEHGQAQFTVSKDPQRPFRVRVGPETVTAIGTSFDVDYVAGRLRVTLIEGRLAVVSASQAGREAGEAVGELEAGQALDVDRMGHATLERHADVVAAIAWRDGKVLLRDERMADAVARINRYTRTPLALDAPTLADLRVSGVFEAGNARAFAEAVAADLPVDIDYSRPGVIRLVPRSGP